MILSRNWLNEFVPHVSVDDIDDKAFSEALTISGSKVETYEELGAEITVIGEFQSYEENGMIWYHLVNARLA